MTKGSEEYAIVGFDPGNTSAIAVIDFEGALVFSESASSLSFEASLEKIRSVCQPAVFASDVSPAQEGTRRLAAAFGCKTWYPETSLSVIDKKRIVFENSRGGLDVHERDAAAAAFFCLFSVSQVIERAKRKYPENWKERVFLVLRGAAKNLSEEEEKVLETRKDSPERMRQPDFLKIRILRERTRYLEAKIERLDRELKLARETNARHARSAPPAALRPVVLVQNRAVLERASIDAEITKRVLASSAGSRVIVLRRGEQAGEILYVKSTADVPAGALLEKKITVLVYQKEGPRGRGLPCKLVKLKEGQSLFDGEFALVPEESVKLTKEEERRWAQAYLAFLSEGSS
jgi:hypothetical protein